MSCVEGILKAISKNAFIIMSFYGTSFCTAGRKAFDLISKNFLGVAAVQSVGDFVLTLARISIVLLIFFISIELIFVGFLIRMSTFN